MSKTRIILCDDHPLILDGLFNMLNDQPDIEVVGKAVSARTLRELMETTITDILILDFSLPDGDGLDICKQLSKSTQIIGFSGIEDLNVIKHFLRNGAKGYLSKSASNEEILLAIRQVAKGKDYLNHEIALAIATSQSTSSKAQYIPKLSLREKEVLKLIIAENTSQEIAEKLFISVNTVETHRNHLLQKLGAKNLAGLVRISIEKGLV